MYFNTRDTSKRSEVSVLTHPLRVLKISTEDLRFPQTRLGKCRKRHAVRSADRGAQPAKSQEIIISVSVARISIRTLKIMEFDIVLF